MAEDPSFRFEVEFERALGDVDTRPRAVVDRSSRVIWASDNAWRLLKAPVPIQLFNGRLAAEGAPGTTGFADFIEKIGSACDSLLVRGDSRKHWAKVIAWSSEERAEAVCLLLNLSVPHCGVEESGLARALRLTGSETRVLDAFARLNTPREIAETMNVSLSTVRSHLKQIHSKAGVESGVQLAQLVRGYCT